MEEEIKSIISYLKGAKEQAYLDRLNNDRLSIDAIFTLIDRALEKLQDTKNKFENQEENKCDLCNNKGYITIEVKDKMIVPELREEKGRWTYKEEKRPCPRGCKTSNKNDNKPKQGSPEYRLNKLSKFAEEQTDYEPHKGSGCETHILHYIKQLEKDRDRWKELWEEVYDKATDRTEELIEVREERDELLKVLKNLKNLLDSWTTSHINVSVLQDIIADAKGVINDN